jgi:hypothetical protein
MFLSGPAMTMAAISWALSVGVHATCFFVVADDPLHTGFGMWSKENVVATPSNTYTCQEYTFAETYLLLFDTRWKAASGLAYTAGIIGFIFTVLLVGTSCFQFRPLFFKVASGNFLLAGGFSFCTLVGVQSNICETLTSGNAITANSCSYSTGAWLAVAAGFCYTITSAIVWCIPGETATPIIWSSGGESTKNACDVEVEEGHADLSAVKKSKPTTQEQLDTADSVVMGKEEHSEEEEDGKEDRKQSTIYSDAPGEEDTPITEEEGKEDRRQSTSIYSDAPGEEHTPITDGPRRGFCLAFGSNMLFFVGSIFFMWLAVLDLQWVKRVEQFIAADTIDVLKWWWNRTPSDYDDDYVFQTRFHWVSKYQIIYFVGAFAFMVNGFVDFFGMPGFQGLSFIFAGMFGLQSAWMQERDANLAAIFSLISAHLYMLEAIGLVLYYRNEDDYIGRLRRWVLVSDMCFLVATLLDVALSYTGVLKVYSILVAQLETAAAALWLFCGCVYLGATLFGKWRGYFDITYFNTLPDTSNNDQHKSLDALEQPEDEIDSEIEGNQ